MIAAIIACICQILVYITHSLSLSSTSEMFTVPKNYVLVWRKIVFSIWSLIFVLNKGLELLVLCLHVPMQHTPQRKASAL